MSTVAVGEEDVVGWGLYMPVTFGPLVIMGMERWRWVVGSIN
jgi:hypothetical protein